MKSSKVSWTLNAACFLLVALGASAQVSDGDKVWTTVGSAGTLDEKSEGKAFFDHAVVQRGTPVVFLPARRDDPRVEGGVDETDFAVIRYNVTAVDGLFGGSMLGMQVRFLDEGAQVVAHLIEVELATGTETTLLTFDSNDPGVVVSNGYHVHDLFVCTKRKQVFDFLRNAYYIEATLTTSSIAASSAAGIEIIQLNTSPCPG
ncbi:MAG TPA: hypothetical protein VEU30_13075 [Thermoanaerobaculia bacterium]|nr:hypothetical protein [Thermoanaerobaculia bacterium]